MAERTPKLVEVRVNDVDAQQIRATGEPGYMYNGEFFRDTAVVGAPPVTGGWGQDLVERLTSRKFLLCVASVVTTLGLLMSHQLDGGQAMLAIAGSIGVYTAAEAHVDANTAAAGAK